MFLNLRFKKQGVFLLSVLFLFLSLNVSSFASYIDGEVENKNKFSISNISPIYESIPVMEVAQFEESMNTRKTSKMTIAYRAYYEYIGTESFDFDFDYQSFENYTNFNNLINYEDGVASLESGFESEKLYEVVRQLMPFTSSSRCILVAVEPEDGSFVVELREKEITPARSYIFRVESYQGDSSKVLEFCINTLKDNTFFNYKEGELISENYAMAFYGVLRCMTEDVVVSNLMHNILVNSMYHRYSNSEIPIPDTQYCIDDISINYHYTDLYEKYSFYLKY